MKVCIILLRGFTHNLKCHVILGQPKTPAEAENLAKLKEAVSLSILKLAQYKRETQLQSFITSLEALASNTQQNQALNMAADNSYPKPGMSSIKVPNFNHDHHHGNLTIWRKKWLQQYSKIGSEGGTAANPVPNPSKPPI